MINHIHLKMRSFIFIILLSVVCSCSQQNNDDIVVDFNVQNMTYSKIAIVVSPEMIKETNLDKHGKASCLIYTSQNNVFVDNVLLKMHNEINKKFRNFVILGCDFLSI